MLHFFALLKETILAFQMLCVAKVRQQLQDTNQHGESEKRVTGTQGSCQMDAHFEVPQFICSDWLCYS
jgi:hypothetical protein